MSNNNMSARVEWQQDLQFKATSGSGHTALMDGDKANGASPMEMVLMAVGSCSSVDVVSILKKAKQQVTRCEVAIEGKRADSVPAVFTDIHLHFIVHGTDVSPTHVERAVKLSADKYCSVSIMLSAGVNITHSFEVVAA